MDLPDTYGKANSVDLDQTSQYWLLMVTFSEKWGLYYIELEIHVSKYFQKQKKKKKKKKKTYICSP